MEKISLSLFYQLGTRLGEVTQTPKSLEPGAPPIDNTRIWIAAYLAQQQVSLLLQPPYSLKVSREAAEAFVQAAEAYRAAVFPPQQGPGQPPPPPAPDPAFQRNNVTYAAEQLQTVLQAEWGTLAAYFVPQQGIYQTDALIDEADLAFPEQVRAKLSGYVRAEVREAGRSLAFGVPTASGFHMMRAVEAILWNYCAVVEVDGVETPKKSQNWGVYTGYLSKSEETDVKEVLALLMQLKDNHRNLIMHPEMVLTPDDAYRLFQEGQSAIVAMADRLPIQ